MEESKMTNLRIFTDNSLDFVHKNSTPFYEEMKLHLKDTDWIKKFCKKDPTVPTKYSFDFEFEINELDPKQGDYNNAIALYELFEKENIGDAVIYSEKFLAGFVFSFGYEYFIWSMSLKKESRVFGTLFFDPTDGHRQAIARNVISRLYRTVKLTVIDKEDKYELTRFVFMNPALRRMIYYPNLDSSVARFAFIKAFMRWKEETGREITVSIFNKVRLHYSFFCNTNLVDNFKEEEVVSYLLKYMHKNII